MSDPHTTSFLSRVRQNLGTFHPMERQLAEFVLDFPGDLASYAASELASLAGVSNATVTRFIKRLGYRHYEEARLQVREERGAGSPLLRASRSPAAESPFATRLARSQDNLKRSFARLDAEGVDQIARALLAARKIWVLGLRSSQSFASYFRWQLFQIKEDVHLAPHAGDTLGQTLASVTTGDVVVVFAVRRRPLALGTLLAQLVHAGHRVLYISDEQVPRQSGLSWHLYCACDSDTPLDDHVAVTGLCHLLASRVLELAGPAERARMTAIEASHDALREL
ncbi:MAG: MurR/RpiR family transcriptional regulator [Hydrogenophaga sp.]|jgi:DNA-binding MurR/RpiR family transcriptional regulator|nr:MurR/RpiR family transcriptional regulator [Hydrogenophaga sp.]